MSTPHRIFTVSQTEAGRSVVDVLQARLHLSRSAVLVLLRSRQIRLSGTLCSNPDWRVRAGQRIEAPQMARPSSAKPPAPTRERPSGPRPRICFLDEDLVVVDKPAGLTTMRHAEEAAEFGKRGQRFLPETLADLLPGLIQKQTGVRGAVIAVHRLDKETSGLVVFARTKAAEQSLGEQFRARTTERRYLAVVRGRPDCEVIESWLVRDRGDGRRGSGPRGEGQHALTRVRVLEELGAFALVECELETGRTHQVRIHLGEAGSPLCGERIYDRPLHGRPVADGSGIERVALHAASLGLEHPRTSERVEWSARLPRDMEELLQRLRRQGEG